MHGISSRALVALLASLALVGCWDHDGRGRPGYPSDRTHHHDRHGTGYDQGAY